MTIAPANSASGQQAWARSRAAAPPGPRSGLTAGRRSLAGYLAVPRPHDMFKAILMPLAFGVGVLAAGGTGQHTLLRAVVVLAALELLIYPARYQWNDVRGFVADQNHPGEADRGRLPGPIGRAREHVLASCVVALTRLAAVAALPFLLPELRLGGILTAVTAGVFGVAVAYEALRALGTGRTGQVPPPVRPALILLWITVGAGYVVRGLTGLALAVDLSQRPSLAFVAAVTLWACGVSFVTSRWAIEATAFARLDRDQIRWFADAKQAREHLLALVRWLPSRIGGPEAIADGSPTGWAALRGRTSLAAPWNLAVVVAGVAAGLTGRLLVGPAGAEHALTVAVAGGLSALAVAAVPGRRLLAVFLGAVAVLGVLAAQQVPRPVVGLLPWLAVAAVYTRSTARSLRTVGRLGEAALARLWDAVASAGRAVVGRQTWDVLVTPSSDRGG